MGLTRVWKFPDYGHGQKAKCHTILACPYYPRPAPWRGLLCGRGAGARGAGARDALARGGAGRATGAAWAMV